MTVFYSTAADSTSPELEKNKAEEGQSEAGNDDSCRCKEAATMTPRELLKLMMSDLAFWKKIKLK